MRTPEAKILHIHIPSLYLTLNHKSLYLPLKLHSQHHQLDQLMNHTQPTYWCWEGRWWFLWSHNRTLHRMGRGGGGGGSTSVGWYRL